MTVDEFKQKQGSDDVLILDIREPEELAAESSEPGATHMPMGKVFTEAYKGTIPKDKLIVTICKTGGRCRVVTDHLNARGFTADHLAGGLDALRGEESE
jgi:rhodanese-related sulfurtransferase